jgi:4-hydroxy-3-methylbut-2-enyl diphosphate reductase
MRAFDQTKSGLQEKQILLPKPRGFCAGVIRAIDIVTLALEQLGRPVYVRKEIVHNRFARCSSCGPGSDFRREFR